MARATKPRTIDGETAMTEEQPAPEDPTKSSSVANADTMALSAVEAQDAQRSLEPPPGDHDSSAVDEQDAGRSLEPPPGDTATPPEEPA